MRRTPVEYHGISSDQEFLNGIRRKINTFQLTIREEETLKERHRQAFLSQCRFVLIMVMVSAFFWLYGPKLIGSQGTLYIWALLMLSMGSVHEYFREVRSDYQWRL
jgi:hypothetical protein